MADALAYVGGLHVRERRRPARLPPRRPRRDAARQGAGRVPPARPGARPAATFDPDRLTLRTSVNGDVVQEATAADDLIFGVAYQLADLCRLITLEPGDVVLTGTPANSRPMEPGDTVAVEIDGIGRLREHRRGMGRRPDGRGRPARDVRQHPARRARHPRGRGRAHGREEPHDDQGPRRHEPVPEPRRVHVRRAGHLRARRRRRAALEGGGRPLAARDARRRRPTPARCWRSASRTEPVPRPIVIVGASLAGLRAAQALRTRRPRGDRWSSSATSPTCPTPGRRSPRSCSPARRSRSSARCRATGSPTSSGGSAPPRPGSTSARASCSSPTAGDSPTRS